MANLRMPSLRSSVLRPTGAATWVGSPHILSLCAPSPPPRALHPLSYDRAPMMNRRGFLRTVSASLLAAPVAVEAQPAGEVHRVGVILTTSPIAEMSGPEPVHPLLRPYVHALRALRHVERPNLILERRSAGGRVEQFAGIVTDLVRLKADVIVTVGTPMTQRAKEVTTTVPIVFVGGYDPVASGIVQSLARPGGNVTGF